MGAWIEIASASGEDLAQVSTSHPTMGAWIEIPIAKTMGFSIEGRTPRWVRGLK